jgi:uncharacterized protein (UPF0276 family)
MTDVEAGRAPTCLGATYEGGDAVLLERLVEVVDYLEVTPDSMAAQNTGEIHLSEQVLDELRAVAGEGAGIVAHGVGLSIGSASGWNDHYLRLLDELFQALPVRWHSEHLGYTTVDGEPLGTMLALPRTDEALELVCRRVASLQERYPAPFLLENIARMLPDADADYDEAEFLNELCERTGCGLILDVYNLECDAHNHGFDIDGFLDTLDFTTVHELHVAGGVQLDGMRLDVHSRESEPSTLALAARTAASAPQLWGATYEFLPEAITVLGHDVIVNQVRRLAASLWPA